MTDLSETEILRLIIACRSAAEETGSEFIWDQYDALIKKLRVILEEVAGKSTYH